MLLTVPTVSLVLAAGLAVLNLWLSFRVGRVRGAERVSIGDGGNDRVIRRMRAHANFAENGWVVLALVVLIELSVGTSVWLWAAAGAFLIARVLHAPGMDGWMPGRMIGTAATFLLQLVLAAWAVAIPLTHGDGTVDAPVESVPAQG